MKPGVRACALALCTQACTATATAPTDDAAPPTPDAGLSRALEDAADADAADAPGLELGRCVRADNALDCNGELDEPMTFVPLSQGESMRAVRGPQASVMLVFLARTDGIAPGDPEDPTSPDNSTLEILLRDAAEDVVIARYRGRVAFARDTDSGRLQVASGLFVVLDGVAGLSGRAVVADAVLEDRDGEVREGRAEVTIE